MELEFLQSFSMDLQKMTDEAKEKINNVLGNSEIDAETKQNINNVYVNLQEAIRTKNIHKLHNIIKNANTVNQ